MSLESARRSDFCKMKRIKNLWDFFTFRLILIYLLCSVRCVVFVFLVFNL